MQPRFSRFRVPVSRYCREALAAFVAAHLLKHCNFLRLFSLLPSLSPFSLLHFFLLVFCLTSIFPGGG